MKQDTKPETNTLNTSSRGPKEDGDNSHAIRRTVEGHTRPCEECGVVDWQMDASRGEITCNACGIVVEENVIDPGAEWTNRDRSQDRSRVGQPLTYTLADKGLNTTIDVRDLNTGSAGRHGISSQELSMSVPKLARAGNETSCEQINSFATIRGYPSRCKKKLPGFIDVCLAKASSPVARLQVSPPLAHTSLHGKRTFPVKSLSSPRPSM